MFVNLKTYWEFISDIKLIRLFVILFLLVVMSVSSLNIFIDSKLPNEQTIRDIELQIPLKIYSSDRKLIGEFCEQRRTALKLMIFLQII